MIRTALDPQKTASILESLSVANAANRRSYPGEPAGRQPVHTVYGGAHLFAADTAVKLGQLAQRHLAAYAPDPESFARALVLPLHLAEPIYTRTLAKLAAEPVEDFRIDFEDGFGNRPDAEEDATAVAAAGEVARGMKEGVLPPFIGIRVKTLSEELKRRSIRTLEIFLVSLLEASGGALPSNFVITLPKIPIPEQVAAFADVLDALERALSLPAGALKIELMIELTQSILDDQGRCNLPLLLRAARGRCVGAHFGTYDYTASANITAQHQVMDHPACDFAKQMMLNSYASTGIFLSDGATNIMPVGPHRGADLTSEQRAENRAVVHAAWRTAFGHVRHSLRGGFYQGWDLHPGQLPVRYAAVYSFFLEGLASASERLRNFIDKAAQATLVGDVFDDAATGQGLLNYFLRALNCGAVTLEEVQATGLSVEEIQGRSFVKILENRRRL